MPIPIPHHHGEKQSLSMASIRDFVVGMSDGLTVPFALAAGLSGAVHSTVIIITAGIAEIIAGTISMGLGGYLAGQTEVEHYEGQKKREEFEVKRIPQEEMDEVKNILETYGISNRVRKDVAKELAKDHKKWVDFMMRFELGLEKPDPNQAFWSAFRIGLSYAVGGLVPLSAYFFVTEPLQGLEYSSAITVACVFVFGFFKARVTHQNPWKGAVTVTLTGILAAGAAFGIARLING
jgi:VIT1/CCC1 family predicted Fe2+/Mn2+ transporter